MKFHSLPVKRRPVQKGIFKRLRAVTGNRKQRLSAAAGGAAEMEAEDSSSKISRALTIIFLIHIVAIGLLFVHWKFLDGRSPVEAKTAESPADDVSRATASAAQRRDLPRMAPGEKPYIVRPGDNYSRIAASVGVDEGDLKLINQHADIVPGLLLKIPPKRIVAMEPPEVTAIRNQTSSSSTPAGSNAGGLVDAVDTRDVPRARLVRPTLPKDTPKSASVEAPASASGKSYVVQNGDSVWRIANRYKVSQTALMRLNNISDARKIKPGITLSIPR